MDRTSSYTFRSMESTSLQINQRRNNKAIFLLSLKYKSLFSSFFLKIDFLPILIRIIEQDLDIHLRRLPLPKNKIDKHYQEIKFLLIRLLIHFSFHQQI